jgi:hypothetical protein
MTRGTACAAACPCEAQTHIHTPTHTYAPRAARHRQDVEHHLCNTQVAGGRAQAARGEQAARSARWAPSGGRRQGTARSERACASTCGAPESSPPLTIWRRPTQMPQASCLVGCGRSTQWQQRPRRPGSSRRRSSCAPRPRWGRQRLHPGAGLHAHFPLCLQPASSHALTRRAAPKPSPQAAAAARPGKARAAGAAHGSTAASAAALIDEEGTDLSEFVVPSNAAVGGKRSAGSGSGSGSGSDDDVRRGARGGPPGAPLPPARKPQVIFCSRTHSQLSQFVGELHRTRFADTLSLVAVASRRALCINEQARGTARKARAHFQADGPLLSGRGVAGPGACSICICGHEPAGMGFGDSQPCSPQPLTLYCGPHHLLPLAPGC